MSWRIEGHGAGRLPGNGTRQDRLAGVFAPAPAVIPSSASPSPTTTQRHRFTGGRYRVCYPVQVAPSLTAGEVYVRSICREPSAAMVKISAFPERLLWNAIQFPSPDQVGSMSVAGLLVRR